MPNTSPAISGSGQALETERHTQISPIPSPKTSTPSKPKYLYFAYGSNLSPTQMASRCTTNPTSSKPLAIARLPHWRWLICEAGYANVLPPSGLRVPKQDSAAPNIPVSGSEDTVYGVLYEMDSGDERILDGYEGVDTHARNADGRFVDVGARPREQGSGSYNKWYVGAEVVKWLDGADAGGEVGVLVYVDENCVTVAKPKFEYIARMNRGIRESVALGLPQSWIDEVVRKAIPQE
jgi:hypothetical protein